MIRDGRWATISSVLCFVVWGVLGWILFDPDLRGVQEGLGWWMAAIALAPMLLAGVLIAVSDSPDDGDGATTAWADRHGAGWRGEDSCGGCGG
ncbi:hypothetical protein OOK31_22750 [Streptomyces sp. NBC_00249]|uniref:hypothetical protein n=1 Tax=Streptomyces sp. NBC_00249 TaxID=2975690 RepID=UPI00224E458B|nr:hypothetical protein [Streptomyces sp. NBC_00249]MCX5196676.1 hypothetical protein [Streptomyces sp. NBC_00249]